MSAARQLLSDLEKIGISNMKGRPLEYLMYRVRFFDGKAQMSFINPSPILKNGAWHTTKVRDTPQSHIVIRLEGDRYQVGEIQNDS